MQVTVLFGATLMVAVLPDVVALPPPSAVQVRLSNTKFFTSAGNDADERLFRNTLPNAWHVPAGNTPAAVRLTAASPKVPAGRDSLAIGSVTVTPLTAPSASPRPLRSTRLPQHGTEFDEKHWLAGPLVTHLSRPSTGLPLPPKSNVMSRSPALRLSVFGPVVVRSGCANLLISKSMFAEPKTLDRSQAR